MKIKVWGNFQRIFGCHEIQFSPNGSHGAAHEYRRGYMTRIERETEWWVSRPVCVTIEVPPGIEDDIPAYPIATETTGTVEVG